MPTSLPVVKNLQHLIWQLEFRSELKRLNRYRKYTNLAGAESIGILFDASQEQNYLIVYDFARQLLDQQKKIKALGFINGTNIPHYCHPLLSFDYFTLKDLNWYKKPVSQFVRDFISLEFDIAINLDTNNIKYLTYVTGLSLSRFKVGKYRPENTKYFDLMIDVKDSGNIELLLKEITHYLTVLEPGKTEVKK